MKQIGELLVPLGLVLPFGFDPSDPALAIGLAVIKTLFCVGLAMLFQEIVVGWLKKLRKTQGKPKPNFVSVLNMGMLITLLVMLATGLTQIFFDKHISPTMLMVGVTAFMTIIVALLAFLKLELPNPSNAH